MGNAYALGIDVGSTNVKAVLVRAHGELAATAGRPIASHLDGAIAEQDADEVWAAVVGAIGDLVAARPDAAPQIVTIAVCSQYSTTFPVDRAGRPTAPGVLYLDTRGTDHCWNLMGAQPDAFEVWVERHGIPPVGGGLSLAHVLHLQLDRPEVHERTTAYLEPMDLVNLRLTGRIAATQATQFTMQLCDNRTVGTTTYDADLVARSGVDPTRLPPLVDLGSVVGELTPDAAAVLGLPAGIEVRTGMNDSHAGAIATGAATPGHAGLMIGTTAVLLDTVDHMGVDLDHEVLSMPAPAPGRYLVWAENGVAGKSVETGLTRWLLTDDALGASAVGDPFAHLDDAIAESDTGAGGVLFLPWLAGSLAPRADRGMRGAFLGLSLETTRVELVRAMVEGTAHNLAWLLPAVEAFSGHPIDELVFGGGAARSAGWAQVIADVVGRPVSVLTHPAHAAARAVAWDALEQHGAASRAVEPATGGRHEPDPAAHERYRVAQERFEAAFEATRPLSPPRPE